MKKRRALIDVDGVVFDLMTGFKTFVFEHYGERIDLNDITTFHIAKAPEILRKHPSVNFDIALDRFLQTKDVYQKYEVPVIEYAQAGVVALSEVYEVAFCTATLENAPESYESKFRALRENFGSVPVISCPSRQKHWISTDIGIDDRFDTCSRYEEEGARGILFRQPWNEAPKGQRSYDWRQIVAELCA